MASRLRWPWQPNRSRPPLVSMSTSDSSMPVSILTDDTCAMWIVSSWRPIQLGVYCTTLVGVISTCVGKRRLPRLSGSRGRRRPRRKAALRQTTARQQQPTPTPRKRPRDRRMLGEPPDPRHSPVTRADVKLFPTDAASRARVATGSRSSVLSGKPIRYYRPKGSQEIRHLIDEGSRRSTRGGSPRPADLRREDAGEPAQTRPSG